MIRVKKKPYSAEEIYDLTNGGYDIFKYYLGNVKRLMSRPWGKRETKPSWGVFQNGNLWFYKDFAKEETGNAISFVMKMFSISYSESIEKITNDLFLKNSVVIGIRRQEQPRKEYSHISFSTQDFKKGHHLFWNCVGISEDFCKKYNCFALKDYAINRKKCNIGDEIAFAYFAEDINRVKLYFPFREKGLKFINNVPYRYLWNINNVQEKGSLIIQKSMKDLLVTSLIRPRVIATQAEAFSIFDQDTVSKIQTLSDKPFLFYGSDEDGVSKSIKITGAFDWNYINTPREELPDINDTYGYVKKYGLGRLEELFQMKGI